MPDFKGFDKTHPNYTKKLTSRGAKNLLNDLCTLTKEELTTKYGDLSKLTGYLDFEGGE